MSKCFAVAVPMLGASQDILPPMLEKVLSGAVLTSECLLLPADSIRLELSGGVVLTSTDLRKWLLPWAGGSISVSEWSAYTRGFTRTG